MAKQDIDIALLRPGMHIVGIDISWLDSPFIRHSFKISQCNDIQKLVKAGVRIVTIERSKSDILPEQVEAELAASEASEMVREQEASVQGEIQTHASNDAFIEPQSLEQELAAARKLRSEAKRFCKQVFTDLEQGNTVDMEIVSSLTDQIIQSLTRNNQAIFTLLHLQRANDLLYEHAFSTMSLALAMSDALKLPREDQELVAFAALVHDIGWVKLPSHLFSKGRPYLDAERSLVRKHPDISSRMIKNCQDSSHRLSEMVAKHHRYFDGIEELAEGQVNSDILLSILVVADRYDELVHSLEDFPGMIPKLAIRSLYMDAQEGKVDIRVVQSLITLMGVYPISTALVLRSGEKAVVTECHREAPAQPSIRVYYDKKGRLLPKAVDLDLSALQHDDARQVDKAIDARSAGVDPAQVLNITEADIR